MIKITATGTFTEEEIVHFATHELGYQSTLVREIEVAGEPDENGNTTTHFEFESYPNPVSAEECVASAFSDHAKSLFGTYKSRKLQEATAAAKAQLSEAESQVQAVLDQREATAIEVVVEDVE